VLLVAQGRTKQEVALWHGIDPSSVARWVRRFNQYGLDALRDGRRSGRPGRLDSEQLQALSADLKKHPRVFRYAQASWNGFLLATHLENRYGVNLSVRQCQRLLRQLMPEDPPPVDDAGPATSESGEKASASVDSGD
jgi:transposase